MDLRELERGLKEIVGDRVTTSQFERAARRVYWALFIKREGLSSTMNPGTLSTVSLE